MSSESDDQAGVPLFEALSDVDEHQPHNDRKRKRTTIGENSSKKVKRQSRKPKDIEDDALDENTHVNHAIAHMDPSLMADHVAQRTKKFGPDLSVVEAEDLHIPEQAILDTTSFTEERTAEHMADFMEHFISTKAKDKSQKLSSASNVMGSPHTLVIAAAGLRAADLTRALRRFQTKSSMVAKLFAKHIKLKEASETTMNTRMGIGVGTPQRIIDLLNNESLKLDHLERIVIDASHIDQKKRGILDMKEIQRPLVTLLCRPDLKDRYIAEKRRVKLLFF